MDLMDELLKAAFDDQENRFRVLTGRHDWIYRDVPWMTSELFEEFTAIIGADNIHWIVCSTRGTYVRGQAMFSPAGVANVERWLYENR